MNLSDLFLVIISSTGLLHGVTLAVYLLFFKKKKPQATKLLAFILIVMAFRIGKSVMLNFSKDLEPLLIFAGLALLLIIGPLLRWYTLRMTSTNFKWSRYFLTELIPFACVFLSSFFITKSWLQANNREAVIVFASTLIFIYLHFAFYIFVAYAILKKTKKDYNKEHLTKSQKAIITWLGVLIVGFVVIWISYFLNIIEDTIPYITGPIMYSVVVYYLSFKAFQLKIIDMDGHVFKNEGMLLFNQISKLIGDKELYLNPNLSLSSISELIGKSPQKTSEVINQYANQNFNDLINSYRIKEAKNKLIDTTNKKYTIASIAFDVGFNSLSSFNHAFKKFEGITPSLYRKEKS